MKNFKLIALLMLACSLVFVSCDDDDNGDDDGPPIDQNATFTQMDQVGRPSINTVFTVSDADENRFNNTVTANLGADFGTDFVARVNALNPFYTTNLLGFDAQALGTTLAADFLTVAREGETNFFVDTSNLLTGRRLNEDVIDVELILIFGGPNGDGIQESGEDLSGLISDGVGFADREVLSTFPYVETPLGQ
jgi:hypothetical protein